MDDGTLAELLARSGASYAMFVDRDGRAAGEAGEAPRAFAADTDGATALVAGAGAAGRALAGLLGDDTAGAAIVGRAGDGLCLQPVDGGGILAVVHGAGASPALVRLYAARAAVHLADRHEASEDGGLDPGYVDAAKSAVGDLLAGE